MKRSELFFGALLIPIDLAMLFLAYYFAYTVRASTAAAPLTEPLQNYLQVVLYLLPFWLIIFALIGLYSFRGADRFTVQFGRVVLAVSASTMLAVILGYLSPNPYFALPIPEQIFPSKYIPVYGLLFSTLLVISGRLAVNQVRRFLFKFDIGVHRILILGGGKESELILDRLTLARGYKVVGVIESNLHQILDDIEGLGHIDDILIADTTLPNETLVKIIETAEARHIAIRFVPTTFGIYAATSRMTNLAGLPVIEVMRTPLDGWGRILKRLFDAVLSLAALIIFSPFFILIAVLIKLTMPGPIFFRHKRLGRHGKVFEVIKFRSMVIDAETRLSELLDSDEEARAEWEMNFKLKKDQRVTSLGRFLRRYSLDELPQLFNVLTGEMSLVGPRPIVPGEQERYGGLKHGLLVLKPGLTGPWQVMGRSDISYKKRVELDAYYIERWSLLLDVIILIKTLRMLVGRANGY